MPIPFMCHECDSHTMNTDGICDNCIEPTTADEYNKELFMEIKDVSPHDPGDENDNLEQAYLEGEKNPLKAIQEMEKKLDNMIKEQEELISDLENVAKERDELKKVIHMLKELAMLRDNYGMIESVAEEALNGKK